MYGSTNITTRGIEMLAPGEPIPIRNAKGKVTGQIAFNQF